MNPDKTLRTRLIVAAILAPLVIVFIFLGGWPFAVLIGIGLVLAGWEYWRIFRVGDFSPSLFLMVTGILSAIWLRYHFQFQYMDVWLAGLILVSMTIAVIQQAQSVTNAAFNFAITISGILYIGWLGSYAVSVRSLSDGLAWTLLVIFSAAMSDTGGYLFGSLFGKHKISLALSPKKSWEGYFGGVLVAAVSTYLGALLCHLYFPAIKPMHGLILGAVLAVFVPLGDFAESMVKRLFNLKDTSHLLPGHGGILDRIDSSLWALPIGFYLLILLK